MNEAETRAEHIDHALKAAAWGVVEGNKILPPKKAGGHLTSRSLFSISP
jgi:hypothetical protein